MERVGAKKIVDTPEHDYPCRIFVTREVWASYLVESAMDIDYINFKDRALKHATQDRNSRYHKVWAAMAFPDREHRWVKAFP
jgi:hypothetical protein